MRTIAKNTVYNEEQISLQDGTELMLRPAVISVLRKGNAKMAEFPEAANEDEALTVLVAAAFICIKNQIPEKDEAWAEDAFDMESLYKILEVCLGIKLNNPKLLEAVQNTMDLTE